MLQHRLIIIAGKGGVGRTTVACALALVLSRRGRRTLLAQVRAAQQLGSLLGAPHEIGEEITEVRPNLWAVNMDPRAAIREMGLLVLRFRSVYRIVLENRIVRSFLRAVPALEEYSMVGKAWYHTTEELPSGEPRFDTVIFDGPATGHLVSMLRIPQVILDAVPDGPLTGDARKARALLSDPRRTCIWLVTLGEEMAASEAIDLYYAAEQELDIAVERLVVNRLYPSEFGGGSDAAEALGLLQGRELPAELRALVGAAQTVHARRQINEQQLARLTSELPVRCIELPHLFVPQVGRDEIELLADRIEAGLERPAGREGAE